LIADTLRRPRGGLAGRERWVETLLSVAYVAGAATLLVVDPPQRPTWLFGILATAVMCLASRVQFDTPFGFTVATELAFVPLLFAVPVTLVPIVVPAAMIAARAPELWRGEQHPARLLKEIVNSWFVLGPVAVLALSGTRPDRAGAAVLVLALLAQFALDAGVSSLRFCLEREATLIQQLRECWVYAIDAALATVGLVIADAIARHPVAVLAPLPLLALLATFARERRERLESLTELNAAYHGIALVLGDVVEADDGYTGEHCRKVVQLALELGARLGVSGEQRRNLEFGALPHDIGKIAIPNEIINKPGKLTDGEWAIMSSHTVEGQRLLEQIGGFMRDVGAVVRSHHERWDGGGYPDGIGGDAIPLETRIITCCDSWNAMRTDRSYRTALSFEAARAEVRENIGTQFDPVVARAFLDMIGAPEPGYAPPREPGGERSEPVAPAQPALPARA
jgi:HD-GYP domain-containing protein (c-di-GMP phosphodiesterase class II)